MKRNIFIAIVLLLFSYSNSSAQHCPFDGSSIIMVNIFSGDGVLQNSSDYDLTLKEIDNPHADTCEYAKGLLNMKFKPVAELYNENNYISSYEKKMNVNFTTKGSFYVMLNMAEMQCMQHIKSDFTYYDRKFLFVITNKKTGKQRSFSVPKKKIFELCTNGDWKRINALDIKI